MRRILGLVLAALAVLSVTPADAAPKKDFKVCWSIYVGWMPWGHLQSSGIMKKWADKYGITRRYRADQRLCRIDQPIYGRRL